MFDPQFAKGRGQLNVQTEKKLIEIFRVILDVDESFDVLSVRRINESRWDSLAHMSLVAAIESEFNIELDISEMERLTSFLSTRLLLEEKGL